LFCHINIEPLHKFFYQYTVQCAHLDHTMSPQSKHPHIIPGRRPEYYVSHNPHSKSCTSHDPVKHLYSSGMGCQEKYSSKDLSSQLSKLIQHACLQSILSKLKSTSMYLITCLILTHPFSIVPCITSKNVRLVQSKKRHIVKKRIF